MPLIMRKYRAENDFFLKFLSTKAGSNQTSRIIYVSSALLGSYLQFELVLLAKGETFRSNPSLQGPKIYPKKVRKSDF